jgi:excisionase family DNA binding protein
MAKDRFPGKEQIAAFARTYRNSEWSSGHRGRSVSASPAVVANIVTDTDQLKRSLVDVKEAANILGVSESWIRRHLAELPVFRVGRLIRINRVLLAEKFQGTTQSGNSLKPERKKMTNRYQRGCVVLRGKKGNRVWYGKFREDIQTSAGMERQQRLIRLGTVAELPTKNAARNKLAEMMSNPEPMVVASITFGELVNRWEIAEGPTMKSTTLQHYKNTLRASVLPYFRTRDITSINREDIQRFLGEKAKSYSTSTLRSMRVVLGLTLGWAEACGWLQKNPCTKIKLPRQTGGRTVRRTFLSAENVTCIASELKEPYATLVLFL